MWSHLAADSLHLSAFLWRSWKWMSGVLLDNPCTLTTVPLCGAPNVRHIPGPLTSCRPPEAFRSVLYSHLHCSVFLCSSNRRHQPECEIRNSCYWDYGLMIILNFHIHPDVMFMSDDFFWLLSSNSKTTVSWALVIENEWRWNDRLVKCSQMWLCHNSAGSEEHMHMKCDSVGG